MDQSCALKKGMSWKKQILETALMSTNLFICQDNTQTKHAFHVVDSISTHKNSFFFLSFITNDFNKKLSLFTPTTFLSLQSKWKAMDWQGMKNEWMKHASLSLDGKTEEPKSPRYHELWTETQAHVCRCLSCLFETLCITFLRQCLESF